MVLAAVSISTRLAHWPAARDLHTSSPCMPGRSPVKHDHVVAGQGHVAEGLLPVEYHVDGHALTAQPGSYRLS